MTRVTLIRAHVLDGLRSLRDSSVHCVVTSPPYWGLRDYGLPETEWGDGWRGQLGLEPTPEQYVGHLVEVFQEVRRVLRPDGTLWLNLGDSYATGGGAVGRCPGGGEQGERFLRQGHINTQPNRMPIPGLKPKDLVGIPWRVAFALQADGWVLRSDVCWAKPNPMPESVRDRPTKSHEYVFLLSKAKWVGPPSRQFDHISDEDARWLALFVDTEGSIVLRREKAVGNRRERHAAQVSVGGTCRDLVERARDIVGHGNVLERVGKNAPMHYWQVSNSIAADLLHRIYPHLIVKQRQAQCCIHVEDRKDPSSTGLSDAEIQKRDDLWRAVKSLNQFGSPDIGWVPEPAYGRWDSQPYFYDAEAVREDDAGKSSGNGFDGRQGGARATAVDGGRGSVEEFRPGAGRNKRSVWTIPTQPFPDAHFAVFPPALVEPCILAGTSERGICPECGAPWERVVSDTGERVQAHWKPESQVAIYDDQGHGKRHSKNSVLDTGMLRVMKTTGWRPTCDCYEQHYLQTFPQARKSRKMRQRMASGDWWRRVRGRPCPAIWPASDAVVLDPFAGAATVGVVCAQHGRRFIGTELSAEYVAMARRRMMDHDLHHAQQQAQSRTRMAPVSGPLFEGLA